MIQNIKMRVELTGNSIEGIRKYYEACINRDASKAFRLIDSIPASCIISIGNGNPTSPLCLAVASELPGAVNALLRNGAKANETLKFKVMSDGWINAEITPLGLAVQNGNGTIAETLLINGADPNIKIAHPNQNTHLVTPLYLAAEMGNEPLIKLLASKGASTQKTFDKHGGSTATEEELLRRLAKNGAWEGVIALHEYARAKYYPGEMEAALKAGYGLKLRETGHTIEGHESALLLEAVNAPDKKWALHHAKNLIDGGCIICKPKSGTENLSAGFKSSADSETDISLLLEITKINGPIAIYYITKNLSVLSQKNENGQTLLHLAAQGNTEQAATLVHAIIELGADPLVTDNDGNIPLHLAATPEIYDLMATKGGTQIANRAGEYPQRPTISDDATPAASAIAPKSPEAHP